MSNIDSDTRSDPLREATDLLSLLIQRPSVTPADEGCQDLLAMRLDRAGFRCEAMPFDDVSNLWARIGTESPLVCFAGHTDVVPIGPAEAWTANPFEPFVGDGWLYGRGAADMKGGLAAMVVAAEAFVKENKTFAGSLAFLLTSDEEGPAVNGTTRVIEALRSRGEQIDFCVIGEPSSDQQPGDVIRIGRRGSLSGRLVIHGRQGHVAYPHLADNPIHRMTALLAQLQTRPWDSGNSHFPPTSFQLVNFRAGVGAPNVIPPLAEAEFNFRYSTEWTFAELQCAVEEMVAMQAEDYALEWHLYGEPFLTKDGKLICCDYQCNYRNHGSTT